MYNNDYVQSDLVSPRQWIRTIEWIVSSGYNIISMNKIGNFSNSIVKFSGLYSTDYGNTYILEENKSKNDNWIMSTGITDDFKTNNVYDLFGNLAEFTDGYVPSRGYLSAGGHFAEPASLSFPLLSGVEPSSRLGFRIVLYIKES